jgi:chaperone BCS1
MLMLWVSSQSFAQNARSSLVTADLASSLNRSRNDPSNGGDANKKTLYYTPWNGRFPLWYKGRRLAFRRQYQAGDFSSREEVSISCFGKSPQILKELLSECRTEYANLVRGKTCIYEHQDGTWTRSAVVNRKRIETVVLNRSGKRKLLKDIKDFLDPTSQRWYSNRDIPYRRGYLLYGPPGTGKSSLSKAIAGHFSLNIYILSLSAIINEATLTGLFRKLPSRCVILLEDVDAVSSNRDAETEDSRQIVAPSREREPASEKVSLSALLNVIDGVASHEGRILIMTTNHITRLDEALIRPGRVDQKVELGLADKKMTADLFRLVFKPMEGDVALPEDAQSGGLVGEDEKVPEAAWSQNEEAEVERLAEEFAAEVPQLEFSPAEILSFLSGYRKSPEEAIGNVSKLIEAKSKALRMAPAEMVHSGHPLSLPPSNTPPNSPGLSPVAILNDDKEIANAITAMRIAPTASPFQAPSSQTPLGSPPPSLSTETTSATSCPPTPCQTPPPKEPSSQAVIVQFAQEFLDIVKSLSTKQGPPTPPPTAADKVESEEPKARASTLEFKKVNEVYVYAGLQFNLARTNTIQLGQKGIQV